MPWFKTTIIGCYVRVNIGTESKGGMYRIAEITDVVESSKIYALGRAFLGAKLWVFEVVPIHLNFIEFHTWAYNCDVIEKQSTIS